MDGCLYIQVKLVSMMVSRIHQWTKVPAQGRIDGEPLCVYGITRRPSSPFRHVPCPEQLGAATWQLVRGTPTIYASTRPRYQELTSIERQPSSRSMQDSNGHAEALRTIEGWLQSIAMPGPDFCCVWGKSKFSKLN